VAPRRGRSECPARTASGVALRASSMPSSSATTSPARSCVRPGGEARLAPSWCAARGQRPGGGGHCRPYGANPRARGDRRRRGLRLGGCRALTERLDGVGPIAATAILAELGDCRRFSSSDDAVRHAGLDVTVYQSDSKRAAGHLSHEGAPVLRWALYEPANRPPARPRPTTSTSCRCANGPTTKAPRSRSHASSAAAPSTSCASSANTRSCLSTPTQTSRRQYALPPDQPTVVRASSSSRRCSRPAPAQVPPPPSIRPGRPPQTERPQAAQRGERTPHRSSCRHTASPSTEVRLGAPRAPTRQLPSAREVTPVR
jgi:Transposase IS116/IS110/IS902 family